MIFLDVYVIICLKDLVVLPDDNDKNLWSNSCDITALVPPECEFAFTDSNKIKVITLKINFII